MCFKIWCKCNGVSNKRSKAETLEWLDKMLFKITKENPDRFVFVGTHAPVVEEGTYGTDRTLEGGAVWATVKNNIDAILSKYPQVIVFTGHTYFSLELETAIMQKNYTAINISPVLPRDYYNSQYSEFLDSQYPDKQFGMGLYIEVDVSGNIRIKRVNFSGYRAEIEISSIKKVKNPEFGKYANMPSEILSAEMKECRIKCEKDVSVYGNEWVIDDPIKKNAFEKIFNDTRMCKATDISG